MRADEKRADVRCVEGEDDYFANDVSRHSEPLFVVAIDDGAGCGISHTHDFGHDFAMTRSELVAFRSQIDEVLAGRSSGGE